MKKFLTLILVGLLASCGRGPQGRLALPEQNIVKDFVAEERYRSSWKWTLPGLPAILSLSSEGAYKEMIWSVSDKTSSGVRRSRIASLQLAPRFFTHGPQAVTQVRFSPSGETILAQEFSRDGARSQTVLFKRDRYTGAWRSRYLHLEQPQKTTLRELDDRSRVPALLEPAIAPRILRLDENLVIYEVDGKTRSQEL